MKQNKYLKIEAGTFELDDNWWMAVMADEDKVIGCDDIYTDDEPSQHDLKKTHEDVDWDGVITLQEEEKTLKCQVVGYNRGGLLVEGSKFHGFVPISHLVDVTPAQMTDAREPCLAEYVGREIDLKVIECDPQRGRVVLSERVAQCAPGERQRLFNTLESGEVLEGEVTNITDFGVFVDLGGVEGLVHISELSWGRVCHPGDHVEVGGKIKVQVLQVDCDRGRVALSVKRLYSNPWETAVDRFQLGEIIKAEITDVVQFGAFARLEEGLEGLIHVSQMSNDGAVAPWQIVSEGDQVQVRILQIDTERQRMSLKLELDSTLQKKQEGINDQI
jgi:small subunit ribosomal protein S1